jgi:hypothetical protein
MLDSRSRAPAGPGPYPRERPEGSTPPEPTAPAARSSVTLWSAPGRSRRQFSIRVVDGITARELAELVTMALDAEQRVRSGVEP